VHVGSIRKVQKIETKICGICRDDCKSDRRWGLVRKNGVEGLGDGFVYDKLHQTVKNSGDSSWKNFNRPEHNFLVLGRLM
jgi:hypothetical protein